MQDVTRRGMLAVGSAASAAGVTAAAQAASFGNPDEPPRGAVNATGNPTANVIPGPRNQRRILNGGWARQVTQESFPISTTIAKASVGVVSV